MKYFITKYTFILIFVLQTTQIFCEVDPAFKYYNGAIISTLSLGLTLQTAGIALLAYSNNYFLSEVSPLQAEKNVPGYSAQLANNLKKKQNLYNNYIISSVTLFSVGTIGTIVGLGLILSKSINDWKPEDKNLSISKKSYKKLLEISSIQFTPHVTLSIYSLYPAVFIFSIE